MDLRLIKKVKKKFDTLDDKSGFLKRTQKKINFIVLNNSIIGWWDTYIINSILFEGLLMKVATPTYNVFVFFEKSLLLTEASFIIEKKTGKVRFKNTGNLVGEGI